MTPTLLFREQEEQEFDDMGSFNHSTVQGNLAYLLKQAGNYTVPIELSLDASNIDLSQFGLKNEVVPDVCVYPKRRLIASDDILRMSEMPLLAIEVQSPRQGGYVLTQKIKAYFAMGVQSCWLINPLNQVVHVYTNASHFTTFTAGNVIDTHLGIEVPFDEIFD